MPERPEVTAAKEKLATLLPAALDAMEDLLESPSMGARLGAAKDILDRGGVPIHTSVDMAVDIGIDEQIAQLMGRLARARDVAYRGSDTVLAAPPEAAHQLDLFADEPAQPELMAAEYVDDSEVADAEIVEAWWQAEADNG